VHYDHTVRGSDSSVYQFLYGGDGLDVTKQKYLLESTKQQDSLFYFATQNHETLNRRVRYHELANSGHLNEKIAGSLMNVSLEVCSTTSIATHIAFSKPVRRMSTLKTFADDACYLPIRSGS
jgi:DNA-directed RNA polymerase I subunit RPA1